MRIGRHIPTGSQPVRAMRTAHAIGCEAVQIFVTNPRGWREPESQPRAESAFREAARELDLAPVVVHASYLINLASPRDDFFEKSVTLLRATLVRAQRHGAASVVLHIGSHMGAGEEAGLVRLADGVRLALADGPADVMLLLENDVGAGGELGYRFEHLAAALAAVPEFAATLGVCIDTAHLWGAGFDIGTTEGAERTLAELDATVGLGRVGVIHLNDTKVALGSHRDVHARIGEGVIGAPGLETLLRHPGLAHATVLLETPIPETAAGTPDWQFEAAQLRRVQALAGRVLPAGAVEPPRADVAEGADADVAPPAPPSRGKRRSRGAKRRDDAAPDVEAEAVAPARSRGHRG